MSRVVGRVGYPTFLFGRSWIWAGKGWRSMGWGLTLRGYFQVIAKCAEIMRYEDEYSRTKR
jgi:hypothetical protein